MVTAVALLLLLNDKCKPESLQRDGRPGWRFLQTAGCKARTCFVGPTTNKNFYISCLCNNFGFFSPSLAFFQTWFGFFSQEISGNPAVESFCILLSSKSISKVWILIFQMACACFAGLGYSIC